MVNFKIKKPIYSVMAGLCCPSHPACCDGGVEVVLVIPIIFLIGIVFWFPIKTFRKRAP